MTKYSNGNPNVALSTAEATFYDQVFLAEQTYQAADKSTPAKQKTADVARHRSIAAAAAVAGNGGLGNSSRQALWELVGAFV
jgi:hypothetical protein